MSNYYLGTLTAVCGMGIMTEGGGGSDPPPPAYELSFTAAASPDPVASGAPLGVTITCDAVGSHTGLYVEVRFFYEDEINAVAVDGTPSTIDADGWTVYWDNYAEGKWRALCGRSSHSEGSTVIQLQLNPLNAVERISVIVTPYTGYSDQVNPATLTSDTVNFS